jgi:hypothetical protein
MDFRMISCVLACSECSIPDDALGISSSIVSYLAYVIS